MTLVDFDDQGTVTYIAEQVKLASRIFSVNQSTFRLVLQKITDCVMVKVSYKSHKVSNFQSSFSTATKNCLIPGQHTRQQQSGGGLES